MRSRILGSLVAALAALVALGASAAGASAAKPTLWLLHQATHARAATGSPARISLAVRGECSGAESAVLHSNGKPVDQIAPTSSLAIQCFGGEKLAGSIKSVTVAPAGAEEMAMTLNSTLHVLLAPWCTYTVPKKIVFEANGISEERSEPTAPLDKGASFGTCPAITRVPLSLAVEDESEGFAFGAEVVG